MNFSTFFAKKNCPAPAVVLASGGQNPFRQMSLVICHSSLVKKEKY